MKSHKFTKANRETILEYIKLGAGPGRAAVEAGLSSETLRLWRRRGERELREGRRTAFAKFAQEINIELAKHARMMERSVLRHGLTDWRAAAWWLSRMHAADYGEKSTITVEVREQVIEDVLELLRNRLSSDEYARILGVLADPGGGESAPRSTH